MSKVVVTGANGFLGNWLCKRLISEGHHVCAIVRKSSDLSELKDLKIEYRFGDVTDLHSLIDGFKDIDTVFHLAGLIAYKKSQREMMERVNVLGTANVLEACRARDIRKLVYLSSVVAVGAGYSPDQILNEDSEFNVHNLDLGYFETKRKAEELIKEACERNRIDAVMLNPSTIYGPGDAKKGSRKNQLRVAQGKLRYYTSGGVSIVSVTDVVDGIVSAWKKGRTGERYILSGENLLIKDVFGMIATLAGQKKPDREIPGFVLHTLGAFGDLMGNLGFASPISRENAWTATLYHWFDSTKAQTELDFKPQPAQVALSQSVQWMKENGLLDN